LPQAPTATQVGLALSVQVYLSPMSVVEFTSKKGMGTKVSKESAREAEDPDYVEPEEGDDEAPKGKRARGRPARGTKSKDRAEGATAAATSESSGAIEAEGGGSANEDEAEASRPTKSRKVDKAGKAAASSAGAKADGADVASGTSSRKQPKRAAKQAEEDQSSDSDSYEYEEEDNGRRSAGGRAGGGEPVEASGRKGEASASTAGRRKFARRFQKDLPQMLYGFGDVRTPLPQTVQLMEDLVVDYVTQVLRKASAAAEARQRATRGSSTSRIKEADLLFVLRKDRKRLHRVLELLEVFEEQKQARATENVDDMAKSYDKDA
jgi:transcription initiation factor TFIID subunit 13